MKIKLDENIPARLTDVLRNLGHEASTVKGQGWTGKSDNEIWQLSTTSGCLLVTCDLDFADIRRHPPGTHPGLVLVRLPNEGRGAVFSALSRVIKDYDISEWESCFVVIRPHKVVIQKPLHPNSD